MPVLIEAVESRVLMSATPTFTKAQNRIIKRTEADLLALYVKGAINPTAAAAVVADARAIGAVATRPSATTLKTLRKDTRLAFADGKITDSEKAMLVADTQAGLASAGVDSTLAQQTATDVQTVITSSTLTKPQARKIAADVQALLAAFR